MLSGAGQGVLAAMITPAVLISASGTLILSTSNRLGRAADRVRRFSERARDLVSAPEADLGAQLERRMIANLTPKLIHRVGLIHQSLRLFYMGLGLFVLTSFVIGGGGFFRWPVEWLSVLIGLLGAGALVSGVALLNVEIRLSMQVNMGEMQFLQELSALHVPAPDPDPSRALRFSRWLSRALGDRR